MNNKNSYQKAFDQWFSGHESARRRAGLRPGRIVPHYRPRPVRPDDITESVEMIGRHQVLALLDIHRSTLDRWCSGDCVMPQSAWLCLEMMRSGKLPGMTDDWEHFRFIGDRLHIAGTKYSFSPADIIGIEYLKNALEVSRLTVQKLQRQLVEMTGKISWGCANDAFSNTQDVRSRAFSD